jgi:hypothetical protein
MLVLHLVTGQVIRLVVPLDGLLDLAPVADASRLLGVSVAGAIQLLECERAFLALPLVSELTPDA